MSSNRALSVSQVEIEFVHSSDSVFRGTQAAAKSESLAATEAEITVRNNAPGILVVMFLGSAFCVSYKIRFSALRALFLDTVDMR